MASVLVSRVFDFGPNSSHADVKRAEELTAQALAASPRSPLAHFAKGQVLRVQGRPEDAIHEYETALVLDRNLVRALAAIGRCKMHIGPIEEAIPLVEQAIRLSPRDPFIGNWYSRIGFVHLLKSRTEEAIVWLEKARNANPAHHAPRANLAAAYAIKGDIEGAARELTEARRFSADGRYSSIARLKSVFDFGVPEVRALVESTYFAGLRLAGMPEE